MKPLSCIFVLQSLDGYRIMFSEDIRDIVWVLVEDTEIQYQERETFTKEELRKYFQTSELITTKELAWHNAMQQYRDKLNNGAKFIENPVRFIIGFETQEF